jgi:hypothetical protein
MPTPIVTDAIRKFIVEMPAEKARLFMLNIAPASTARPL